jgi:hypothetical protein
VPGVSVAYPGEVVPITIVNGSPRASIYSECVVVSRLDGRQWLRITMTHGRPVACPLVGVIGPPHSRADQNANLFDDLQPGRYRLALDYSYSAESRPNQELTATTYLTVAAPPTPPPSDGVLAGIIQFVGGPAPVGGPRAPGGGLVSVFDQSGNPVASTTVQPGRNFRIDLPAGRYQVNASAVLHPKYDCAPKTVQIQPQQTTRVTVAVGCLIP